MTPLQAIKAKCLDCSAGNKKEVKNCWIPDCPLYPYRDGHNPSRKGVGNPKGYKHMDKQHYIEKVALESVKTEVN